MSCPREARSKNNEPIFVNRVLLKENLRFRSQILRSWGGATRGVKIAVAPPVWGGETIQDIPKRNR